MKKIIYVTSNINKFQYAAANLKPYALSLTQEVLDIEEIQSFDSSEIVRKKAQKAYARLKKPLLINDESWSIPALGGFPSTGMKLCNKYLVATDWLKLMRGRKNRAIFLISHFAFHNGQEVKVFTLKSKKYFLKKPEGKHSKAPCLEVIAREGDKHSIAKRLAEGKSEVDNDKKLWQKLADLIKKQYN